MSITPELVKKLREMSGAPMMECKRALEEVSGNVDEAFTILRKRGQATAAKKASRVATEGLVGSYIHAGGKIGVIVEVNCETDFVARNEEFQQLVHDLAMQICATNPRFVSKEEVTPEVVQQEQEVVRAQAEAAGKPAAALNRIIEGKLGKFYEDACLYEQHFIKDTSGSLTIKELIASKIAKFGENITVRRFSRFKVGEGILKTAGSTAGEESRQA